MKFLHNQPFQKTESLKQPFHKKRFFYLGMGLTLAVFSLGAILLYMLYLIPQSVQSLKNNTEKEYSYHYAFIADNMEDSFWRDLYLNIYQESLASSIYLEEMGKNLSVKHSKAESISMAIAMNLDGIIVEGDESPETRNWINQAVDSGMLVITIINDCASSKRQCFISFGSYELGKAYGDQILDLSHYGTGKILFLADDLANKGSQNLIYTGITETLAKDNKKIPYDMEFLSTDKEDPFETVELLRELFINKTTTPDMIICLNEKDTISAYQAVVDYNMVGKVGIMGYYTSDLVLEAIQKKIISATFGVDIEKTGLLCSTVMKNFEESGHISEFSMLNMNIITEENVKEYLDNEKK